MKNTKLKPRKIHFKLKDKQMFEFYRDLYIRKGYRVRDIPIEKGYCFDARSPRRM